MFRRYKLVVPVVFVLSIVFCAQFMAGRASADIPEGSMEPIRNFAPALYHTEIQQCDSIFHIWAFGSYNWFGMWGSARNRSTDVGQINVPFGASIAPFQINIMSVNCHPQNVTGNIYINNYHTFITRVETSVPGATDNLQAGVTSIYAPYPAGAGPNAGDMGPGSIPVDFRPTGGFNSPGIRNYTIRVWYRSAYLRSDNSTACSDGVSTSGITDVGGCPEIPISINLRVNVGENPNCSDPAALNNGGPLPCVYPCPDPTATNFGGPLPCVYPTCTDPAATNIGQRLPCLYPPSGAMTLRCSAGLVTISDVRVSDDEAGVITVSGVHNGVTFSGSRTGSGPVTIVPGTFSGIANRLPQTVTFTITDAGGATGSMSGQYTCIPPPAVTCTFPDLSRTFEVGQFYYPLVRVSNAPLPGVPSINASVNISVNVTPVENRNTGSNGPIAPGANATFGTGTATYLSTPSTPVVVGSPGDFLTTASASWTSSEGGYSGTVECGVASNRGVYRPYFKVLGGDLISYGSDLRGFNQANATFDPVTSCSSAIRCGAGVETSVQFNGRNVGVTSQYKQATAGSAKTLTYANTLAEDYATWGGGFRGAIPALDYRIPTSLQAFPGFGSIPANANAEYLLSDRLLGRETTAREPDNTKGRTYEWLNPGARITIYRDGDVYIRSNIAYSGNDRFADINAIPHFRLIATGNIYVDYTVDQLDGEYIAQGSIYTCHDGIWDVPIDSSSVNIYDNCNDRTLIVNGSLVGRQVKLTRVKGTLGFAQASDGQRAGDGVACENSTYGSRGYCNTFNLAEIIQFTPELFLTRPATSVTNNPINGQYNSITSLPPLF